MEILSLAIVSILISTLIYYLFFNNSKSSKGLPPGPKPWPIVGNLFQLTDQPHTQFAEMAQIYGDLFTLKMGTQTVVVASSPSSAMQVLKNHDKFLSGRYVFQAFRVPNLIENSIVWSDCNEDWKLFRKICRTEIFTPKMIESQAHVRESKAMEMVEYLKGKEGCKLKIAEVVFGTLMNIFGNLIFSQDVFKLGDPKGGPAEMRQYIGRMLELGNSTNPADYFPVLARFDLFGQRKDVIDCLGQIHDIWGVMLRERKAKRAADADAAAGKGGENRKNDFVEVLLDSGLNDFQINGVLMDLFGAGTSTSASTIEWSIAELTKNPEIAVKMQEELSSIVGQNPVKESDIPNLPYLQAFTKEILRLHPATPLLLPRLAIETCQVMNYTIPKDCQILVNAWAIARDPKSYKDPLKFSPDRFLNSSVDFKGNHFELIPFGGGRRICPGIPLASQFISLMVATIVQNFEWELPNGMHPRDLVMNEKFGLSLHLQPSLYIVPKFKVRV